MLIRRLAAVAVLASAATAGVGLSPAGAAPLPLPKPGPSSPDSLSVTVSDSGRTADAKTYRLECGPAGGSHPAAQSACDQLDGNTKWGKDQFAPTPERQACTQMYGGPATGHIEGTWHGRTVDADFDRSNGCEVARWEKFSKVLTTP